MARLYGKKEDIDTDSVKSFFNSRAEKDVENLMTITSYQTNDIVNKRQEVEIELISEKIDFNEKKILEIGCGLGRWAEFFHDKCDSYVGIDYSENLISIAKAHFNYPNCNFERLSIAEMNKNTLPLEGPFDIIFITGVLLYLNDSDIETVVEKINDLSHDASIIYIRDSVSLIDTRLTLKDFYSDLLEVDYNAIYRTEDELMGFFKNIENVESVEKEEIFHDLHDHEETSFEYFIFRKGNGEFIE